MIPRLSFKICSKYGIQALPLFVWLVAVAYVTSLFVPKPVVAVLLNLVVDKVLRCMHQCERERTLTERHDSREVPDKQPPPPLVPTRQPSLASIKPDDLLTELAEAVVQLAQQCASCKRTHKGPCFPPEPQREKWEIEEPPLPAPPPTGRKQPPPSGASNTRRGGELLRAGRVLSPLSPGTFSPQSTLSDLRRNSLNLNRYQIK
ncbi:hypothetical protein MRX96_018894 [Rhipicephalus microplus]